MRLLREGVARCPHEQTHECPLYIAAHDWRNAGATCMTGDWQSAGCAVDKGKVSYKALIDKLYAIAERRMATVH